MIDGTTYRYDRWLDVVFTESCILDVPLNRTQTDRPVDLCLEITTSCNFACQNCFSNSERGARGRDLAIDRALDVIKAHQNQIIRLCITGGEPLMHPDIEAVLEAPSQLKECGCVLTTNGSMRQDLDELITANQWLTAVSLHGRKDAHEAYTRSDSFNLTTRRIEALARRALVHIYTVVHDGLSGDDVEWLFRFRDQTRTQFLRFMVPRAHGRFQPLRNEALLTCIKERLDARSGLKLGPSLTRFLAVGGALRDSH